MNAVLKFILLWLLTLILFSLADAVWHFLIFGRAYKEDFKVLALVEKDRIVFRKFYGFLAQFVLISSLILLVLLCKPENLKISVLVGLLVGLLAISVYGLTNYALMKDWSFRLTRLEIFWGPVLGAWGGLVVSLLYRWLFR
ncbi:MAG: DUF2177 family protein [Candidatus Saccharicenans sp.]|nr:MAG: hypothetical protein C0168_07395 [Candidatus Aminicenantes bacterium]HEK86114.1 DUF2177 family protein [Candidatus Aminicenantes bacterium]